MSLFQPFYIQLNMKNNTSRQPEKPVKGSDTTLILAPLTPASFTDLHEGDACPKCKQGIMEYDGLLNLSCNQCGFCGDRGVFTC